MATRETSSTRLQNGPPNTSNVCPLCEAAFTEVSELLEHISCNHTTIRCMECEDDIDALAEAGMDQNFLQSASEEVAQERRQRLAGTINEQLRDATAARPVALSDLAKCLCETFQTTNLATFLEGKSLLEYFEERAEDYAVEFETDDDFNIVPRVYMLPRPSTPAQESPSSTPPGLKGVDSATQPEGTPPKRLNVTPSLNGSFSSEHKQQKRPMPDHLRAIMLNEILKHRLALLEQQAARVRPGSSFTERRDGRDEDDEYSQEEGEIRQHPDSESGVSEEDFGEEDEEYTSMFTKLSKVFSKLVTSDEYRPPRGESEFVQSKSNPSVPRTRDSAVAGVVRTLREAREEESPRDSGPSKQAATAQSVTESASRGTPPKWKPMARPTGTSRAFPNMRNAFFDQLDSPSLDDYHDTVEQAIANFSHSLEVKRKKTEVTTVTPTKTETTKTIESHLSWESKPLFAEKSEQERVLKSKRGFLAASEEKQSSKEVYSESWLQPPANKRRVPAAAPANEPKPTSSSFASSTVVTSRARKPSYLFRCADAACDEDFDTINDLTTHMKTFRHGTSTCLGCNLVCATIGEMVRHKAATRHKSWTTTPVPLADLCLRREHRDIHPRPNTSELRWVISDLIIGLDTFKPLPENTLNFMLRNYYSASTSNMIVPLRDDGSSQTMYEWLCEQADLFVVNRVNVFTFTVDLKQCWKTNSSISTITETASRWNQNYQSDTARKTDTVMATEIKQENIEMDEPVNLTTRSAILE